MTKDDARNDLPEHARSHSGFMRWFEDRFCKYDEPLDREDHLVLEESLRKLEHEISTKQQERQSNGS